MILETSKSRLKTGFLGIGVMGALFSATGAHAQSLDVKHPSPLREGPNSAVIDSFGGDQFWTFIAAPGNFKINYTRSNAQEGFSVGGKAGFGAVIAPAVQGSTISGKDVYGGAVYTGHCDKPTKIICMVEKPNSPLVRQTINYTITVSGSGSGSGGSSSSSAATGGGVGAGGATSDSGTLSSTDRVAGVYDVMVQNYGAAKFTADGHITTTSGAEGNWSMFDDATRTYIITIASDKWTLTFEPARGFVDKNGQLLLSLKKALH
jgi:hypothetical protein